MHTDDGSIIHERQPAAVLIATLVWSFPGKVQSAAERQSVEILIATLMIPVLAMLATYGRLQPRNRWLVSGCAILAILWNLARHEMFSLDLWTGFYVSYASVWVLYFVWAKWARQQHWLVSTTLAIPGIYGLYLLLVGLLLALVPGQS